MARARNNTFQYDPTVDEGLRQLWAKVLEPITRSRPSALPNPSTAEIELMLEPHLDDTSITLQFLDGGSRKFLLRELLERGPDDWTWKLWLAEQCENFPKAQGLPKPIVSNKRIEAIMDVDKDVLTYKPKTKTSTTTASPFQPPQSAFTFGAPQGPSTFGFQAPALSFGSNLQSATKTQPDADLTSTADSVLENDDSSTPAPADPTRKIKKKPKPPKTGYTCPVPGCTGKVPRNQPRRTDVITHLHSHHHVPFSDSSRAQGGNEATKNAEKAEVLEQWMKDRGLPYDGSLFN